jgi:glycosyltransferase involved in cell wall biosynthesis
MASKLVCFKPRTESLATQLIQDIQLAKTLQRLLAEGYKWDVIHCHEWNSLQVAWGIRDALGIPLVSTMHLCISTLSESDGSPAVNSDEESKKLLSKIMDRSDLSEAETDTVKAKFALSDIPGRELINYIHNQEARLVAESDETILCSTSYVEMAKRYFLGGVFKKPLNMIYNGIDLEDWNPEAGNADRARREFHLPYDRPIALFVGRVAHMKGLVPLLDALEQADPGYLVLLVGAVNAVTDEAGEAWDVTKKIRSIVKRYPERLRWLEYQRDQTLKDLYASATVGVMPSIHEPFGLVALEFMAMGIPLIATEVDGLGEIVCSGKGEENEYALIIPRNRPEAILKALETLKDETKRFYLRKQGLKRVQDFTWEAAAAKTVDVYRRAIDRKEQIDATTA